ESHFARLKLLDPARYHDLASFRAEEVGYQQVRVLVEKLLADNALDQLRDSDTLFAELESYLGAEAAATLRQTIATDLEHHDRQRAIEDIVRTLVDRHGTGRVLFRNTRETVSGFPARQLHCYPLPAPAAYTLASATASPRALLQPETLLGSDWLAVDPRVAWLGAWLRDLRDDDGRPEKALVICARAETARDLEAHLDRRLGIRTAVFHEGMSLVARDRAAAYFAEEDESAQVLVCSEIGSEGRNFQFVRHLVLFDLPLNPDLVEQRIGRLDRIGQKHDVQIHLPHYDSGPQQLLVRWYHEGLNAFERVCPVGTAIHEAFAEELQLCLASGDPAAADKLIAATRTRTAEALALLQQGRDRLLELSSCNPRRAREVIEAVLQAESPRELADYMANVFDQFGVEHSYHSPDASILAPGD